MEAKLKGWHGLEPFGGGMPVGREDDYAWFNKVKEN